MYFILVNRKLWYISHRIKIYHLFRNFLFLRLKYSQIHVPKHPHSASLSRLRDQVKTTVIKHSFVYVF
jgi:hypothetical protein